MKIAIVGPEKSKWPISLIPSAVEQIYGIFYENWDWHPCSSQPSKESGITLVSGHCPKGGIDIWAEQVASDLGIEMTIYKPQVKQWNDLQGLWGYKSRNMMIARDCDILYCIVPYWHTSMFPNYCKHCDMIGHPSNGGCWTMQYAKKLGKETELVVINK